MHAGAETSSPKAQSGWIEVKLRAFSTEERSGHPLPDRQKKLAIMETAP